MIALLRTYLRPYARAIALIVGLTLVTALGNLYLPTLNGEIINEGVAKGDTEFIIQTGGLMLLVTLVLGVTSIVAVYFSARSAMGLGRDLRRAIFRKVETFSQVEMNTFGPASLITRNTNDVLQVQTVVFMVLTVMITAPIMAVGGIILAVRQDGPLSLLLVVVLPIMAVFIGTVMSRAIPLFRAMQAKLDRINQVMRETLAGVRVIRAFVRTRHEEAPLRRREPRPVRHVHPGQPAVRGDHPGDDADPQPVDGRDDVVRGDPGRQRRDADRQPDGVPAVPDADPVLGADGRLHVRVRAPRRRVRRSHQGGPRHRAARSTTRCALSPCRSRIPRPRAAAGSSSATSSSATRAPRSRSFGTSRSRRCRARRWPIVGSTGSGKSTLVNLIPRLYDATSGTVLVDGVDVRDVDRGDLWQRISFIPQKAFLFTGTVASNLRYGDQEATDEELWQALEIAQARDFVEEMEGGLEAPISQGGANVSGGQRQRLAIARAIVKRRRDLHLRRQLLRARLRAPTRACAPRSTRELGWATVIIVAQRVGTIMGADRILVMDAGRIVGSGTHSELLESNETYREIVYSQLSAEEAVA